MHVLDVSFPLQGNRVDLEVNKRSTAKAVKAPHQHHCYLVWVSGLGASRANLEP
jgi:hypothetical protein